MGAPLGALFSFTDDLVTIISGIFFWDPTITSRYDLSSLFFLLVFRPLPALSGVPTELLVSMASSSESAPDSVPREMCSLSDFCWSSAISLVFSGGSGGVADGWDGGGGRGVADWGQGGVSAGVIEEEGYLRIFVPLYLLPPLCGFFLC